MGGFTRADRLISTSMLINVVAEAMIKLGRTNYTRFFKSKAEGLDFLRSEISTPSEACAVVVDEICVDKDHRAMRF